VKLRHVHSGLGHAYSGWLALRVGFWLVHQQLQCKLTRLIEPQPICRAWSSHAASSSRAMPCFLSFPSTAMLVRCAESAGSIEVSPASSSSAKVTAAVPTTLCKRPGGRMLASARMLPLSCSSISFKPHNGVHMRACMHAVMTLRLLQQLRLRAF
jgi:hypothetical protein